MPFRLSRRKTRKSLKRRREEAEFRIWLARQVLDVIRQGLSVVRRFAFTALLVVMVTVLALGYLHGGDAPELRDLIPFLRILRAELLRS